MSWHDSLEKDLSWREGEVAILKVLASSSSTGTVREQALFRALTVMIYAHYEGFCKFAFDTYLAAVESHQVKRHDCADLITIFSLEKNFSGFRSNLSSGEIFKFFATQFPQLLQEVTTFNIKIETEHNLWPNLLHDCCAKLGINSTFINEHAVTLRSLVGRRNEIAHGKEQIIKHTSDLIAFERAAFGTMCGLAVQIIEAIDSQSFLRLPPPQAPAQAPQIVPAPAIQPPNIA